MKHMRYCPFLAIVTRLAFTAALFSFSSGVMGQPQHEDEAVTNARNALARTNRYPWYDRANDGVRQIETKEVENKRKDVNRFSTWDSQPDRNWNFGWLNLAGLGSFINSTAKVLFCLLVAVILGVLTWLAIRVFLKAESKWVEKDSSTKVTESMSDEQRVQKLPFKVRPVRGDLLEEARHYYEQGNYRGAVIYLFSYMLVQLDKHHFIRLAKGKTNRQYLWETQPRRRLRELLENTMIPFEDVFFGNHDLAREEFERCWSAIDEFHQLVHQGAAG